jgi:hypothetical protein
MRKSVYWLVSLLGLVACGSEVDRGSGGAGGSGGSGGAGGAAVQCVGTTPQFPAFDKGCTMAADCVIALHMVNCCGTLTALGINAAEKAAFEAAEGTCQMQYPGCGCAQSPTTTEDGKMSLDNAQIQVQCTNGQCMTFLP